MVYLFWGVSSTSLLILISTYSLVAVTDIWEGSVGPWYANLDPILRGLYIEAGSDKHFVIFKGEDGKLMLSSEREYDYESRRYKSAGCVFPIEVETGVLLGVAGEK